MNLAFHRILQSLKLTPTPQTPRLWLAHLGLKETRNSARGCGGGGRVCEKDFFSSFFFSLLPLTLILSLWTEEEQIYHSLLGTDTPLLSGVRVAF